MGQEAWWRGAVIYQVYPRSFACADGDGIGDLRGLLQRLDHVAELGVDAIWVCPFYRSPQRDFGYDIEDHCAVDPAMGSLADVDRLIAAAHERGLKVLFDLVAGHTSDRHPWFEASRRDRQAPTADWYVWADPRPDGTPPNNWLSVFGGPAWRWEPRRRQYFLHHFLPTQPALDLAQAGAAQAVLDIARFWLDRGCDGFRVDAVDFLAHDPALADNPSAPANPNGPPAKLFGMQEHRHDMMQPEVHGFLRRLRDVLDRYGAVALGEVSSQPGAAGRIADYTAGGQALHMAYSLRPLRGGFDHAAMSNLLAEFAESGGRGWPCWSFSNHDVPRAATRWGPGGAPSPAATRQMLALLLTLPGTACLYQGEELGLPEAELTEDAIRDPFGLAYWPEFRGRDGSRTPMPWRAAERHQGFSTATPWLPIPEGHRALAVDRQEADPASMLRFCRDWLALRRAHPTLRHGSVEPIALPAPLFGFRRSLAGRDFALVFNMGAEDALLPASMRALPLLAEAGGSSRAVQGWGAVILDATRAASLAA